VHINNTILQLSTPTPILSSQTLTARTTDVCAI